MGLGSWSLTSLPQQVIGPVPALMQSISVLQTSHLYLLPNWLATKRSLLDRLLFLQFHLLTTTGNSAGACFGHNELTTALSTAVSLANLICHVLNTFLFVLYALQLYITYEFSVKARCWDLWPKFDTSLLTTVLLAQRWIYKGSDSLCRKPKR
jgi:hypothetical protein